jgi:PAS domain S-box-containing protein
MERDLSKYTILVVEDNPGDYLLIEDYLHERIHSPSLIHARSFEDARKAVTGDTLEDGIQAVLLDLKLPDLEGTDLIRAMKELLPELPIIVLTGLSEARFAIESLALGVSDYLFKDDLTATALYKAVLYNIERNRSRLVLQRSRQQYSDLFHLSPQPMWVYDRGTGAFLDVNRAAVEHYGFSSEAFTQIKMEDIVVEETADSPLLPAPSTSGASKTSQLQRHRCKDGRTIMVELFMQEIDFEGLPGMLVLASDITERLQQLEAIQEQNNRFREIARMQSHMVRAPLARILGLVDALFSGPVSEEEETLLLHHIQTSALEMDTIVRDIVDKAQSVDVNAPADHDSTGSIDS